MARVQIPEMISNFNVYSAGSAMIGVTGEVTMPTMTAMTSTVSGPGVLGEYETPVPGHFSEIEQTIPFRTLYADAFKMITVGEVTEVTLRNSMQGTDGQGNIIQTPMRIVMRGRCKKIESGKVKVGNGMDAAITLGLIYLLVEVDGNSKIELDKLNQVYKIDGKDQLADIKRMC